MNLLEIKGEVRRLIAESSSTLSYSTDTDINNYINEGIKDMCLKAAIYTKSTSITVVSGTATYKMPLEFIASRILLNTSSIPIDLIELENIGKIYTIIGKPLYYYLSQSNVTLAARANSTAYILWPSTCDPTYTYIIPATANGYAYECTTAGTSHSAPPTFGTTLGGTTAEGGGTVVWTCRELFSNLYTITLVSTPTTAGGGTGTYTMHFSAMDEGLFTDTDSPNFPEDKHRFLVLFACHRHFVKAKDVGLAMAFLTDYSAGLGLPPPAAGGGGAS